MIKNTWHIKKITLVVLLAFVTSCSTKKKTWVHRQYHNTTAKYNGYFNGKESLKSGVKKIEDNYVDDYTATLPVYKMGDLKKSTKTHSYMDKAIKKSSIVIQKHSIKIKGKEYCKWIDDNYLLVGMGYFYKGEYDEAIKTFGFIKNEYKKNEIYYDASLWLVRSYVQKKDFNSAEIELMELINTKRFPEKLELELAKVSADYCLKKGKKELAIKHLSFLDKKIKRKRKKVRYNYILAQIYQEINMLEEAKKQYKKVIKSNPDYEMTFNSKMNLAQSVVFEEKDAEKMRQELVKMTRDDKNKEYLDQIYYTLGEMDINIKDTISATGNYLLSTTKSINNDMQKSISFLSLGKIEFKKTNYLLSKTYYDSTIYYMNEEHRMYEQSKEQHEVLIELVKHLNTIELQDSLQTLAGLSKKELNNIINQIIQKEIKKEKEEENSKRARQQMMFENNINGGRENQFGNKTSGGKWYFYNPATLSFGLSEFRKKWGKRKLEDDWRRKDKKTTIDFNIDSLQVDSVQEKVSENKKDPKYYLSKIPKTKEDFNQSDKQIKEAFFQLGLIYKEKLNKYNKSTNAYKSIVNRFPADTQYCALAEYNIYKNQKEQNQEQNASSTKKRIIEIYPKSIYAQILKNPKLQQESIKTENKLEIEYQKNYKNYIDKKYNRVISETNNIKNNNYRDKYIFLRALSFAGIQDTTQTKKELNQLISKGTDLKIKKEAEYILTTLENPEKMLKYNHLALTGFSYILNEKSPHMSIIILPKKGTDINYLKTLISDYHAKYYENTTFEISAILMGLDRHLLMIKTFFNSSEVMKYNKNLSEEPEILKELNKSDYRLMAISFENYKDFYKNKDLKGYYDFFNKKYFSKN